ncbi:MAG: hypothetical protein AABW85_02855 [archaeon]
MTPNMTVLIPIISKKENNPEFLEKATQGQHHVFLLAIMDTGAVAKNFGFATSEIGHGNELIEEIKYTLKAKKIELSDVLEWGDTHQQIINYAKLKKTKKVALIKQENKYFKDLVKDLKEQGFEVELFEPEQKPKQ